MDRLVGLALGLFFLGGVSAIIVDNYVLPARAQAGVQFDITATNTGTTGAVAVTLAASTTGKTTYICGFVITGGGTASAVVGNATVANTVTGTLNFSYVDVSAGQGLLGVAFPRCIPANATNTAIVVTAPASGGSGTVKAVTAWGYQV